MKKSIFVTSFFLMFALLAGCDSSEKKQQAKEDVNAKVWGTQQLPMPTPRKPSKNNF